MNQVVSPPLQALMCFAKQLHLESPTWVDVSDVLAPIYGHALALTDVIRVAVTALDEAQREPRFELGNQSTAVAVALAPVTGFFGLSGSPAAMHSIESFYNSMIGYILGRLAVARVDWIRN